jgi:hypothetical protein|tara:strand:+ start:276 stop:623 length:348 start_codon:yes stop_codon:yes gene_type:complete
MSSRRPAVEDSDHVSLLRSEISEMKKAALNNGPGGHGGHNGLSNDGADVSSSPALSFEDLSHTEQACASLGAAPEQLRPLGWLNAGHFDQLVKNNQMDDILVRRLEAYKIVAERS